MVNCEDIIKKFYEPGSELWNILVGHSKAVASLASEIVRLHPELHADAQFVYEGAMLHDIGIIMTNAPGIQCFGTADYIRHGTIGAEMLRQLGLERHALVCERHTGAGITADEVLALNLPVQPRDYTPQSIEEKIICYADKFFSKSKKLDEQKPLEKAISSISRFGDAPKARFMQMHELFAIPSIK